MGQLAGKRVLLVDDDEAQREVVEEILLMEEAEVLSAASASEAVALLDRRPDAALLDLHGVHVEPLIAALRQRLPECAVILVSGDVRLHDHAERLGADGCLPKPYEFEQLVGAVMGVARGAAAPDHPA